MCNKKIIHIKAICPYFEIYEILPEPKVVKRLEGIRDSFMWYDNNANLSKRNAKLSVTTGVQNPELPFSWTQIRN